MFIINIIPRETMYKEEMDEVDREAEPSTSQYGEAMFW
jgi:hypothetical protein